MRVRNDTRYEVRTHITPDPEGEYVVINDQDGNPMSYDSYDEAIREIEAETDTFNPMPDNIYIAVITTVGVYLS